MIDWIIIAAAALLFWYATFLIAKSFLTFESGPQRLQKVLSFMFYVLALFMVTNV